MKTVLYAKEISCEHCTGRIDKALTGENIPHEISLEHKTVTIDGDEAVVKAAVELLDDLGFSAEVQ